MELMLEMEEDTSSLSKRGAALLDAVAACADPSLEAALTKTTDISASSNFWLTYDQRIKKLLSVKRLWLQDDRMEPYQLLVLFKAAVRNITVQFLTAVPAALSASGLATASVGDGLELGAEFDEYIQRVREAHGATSILCLSRSPTAISPTLTSFLCPVQMYGFGVFSARQAILKLRLRDLDASPWLKSWHVCWCIPYTEVVQLEVIEHLRLDKSHEGTSVYDFNKEYDEGGLRFLFPACMSAAREHYKLVRSCFDDSLFQQVGRKVYENLQGCTIPTDTLVDAFSITLAHRRDELKLAPSAYRTALGEVLKRALPPHSYVKDWCPQKQTTYAERQGTKDKAMHQDIVDFMKVAGSEAGKR